MTAGDSYYPTVITFLVVDGVAVCLRFWARGIKKAVGYDDVTMADSLASTYRIRASTRAGQKLQAIDYGIGASTIEDGFDLVKAAMVGLLTFEAILFVAEICANIFHAQFFTVAQIVYILATGISKLGVGLVLFRLADKSDMRVVRFTLVASMVVVCIWTLVVALIFALQCRPLSVAWGVGTSTCLSTTVIGNTSIAFGTDVKQGGLATADLIQTTLEATIYSIIEIGLSIFAAPLTALRPLLKRVPCFSDISSGGRSGPHGFAINTFGQSSSRATGPSYRLDDRTASEGGSQENIVPVKAGQINKQMYIESNSSSRATGATDGSVRERW
ncbi:hypothetical protein EDB81DRAFT_755637 [Dactylonectria macrodidyma]|uniref:Rhodopsin domain-containing protein n=1 Tax=Dactylonectria macrodidyma TaxID=307937 RepID=A0A9P9FFT4_9HYPO|nr:hypothetical protein EDB81DRAFT_755637 [Dactylonectria macrodidyma]